jgi:DNA topoisomerase I
MVRVPAVTPEGIESAKVAGLRYVSDGVPGIRRVRSGQGFVYLNHRGQRIRKEDVLARIRALVIPPAWTDVWICTTPRGHLQAVGRDAKGRKQYRYHPRWRLVRDENKFSRLAAFGRLLTQVRQRTDADLARSGLMQAKVLATIVRLLDVTHIRVGNEEYARNGAFGLTTMRDQHARINGSRIRFAFPGKSGVRHTVDLADRRLARIVKSCQDLPGQDLFQYVDEHGKRCSVTSTDVNDYLREITGADFTAKDFRTWAGTVLAARGLHKLPTPRSKTEAKRHLVQAIDDVAAVLGNTRAVCKKCYIHPGVMDAYLDGSLSASFQRHSGKQRPAGLKRLRSEEAALLAFLEERGRQTQRQNRAG